MVPIRFSSRSFLTNLTVDNNEHSEIARVELTSEGEYCYVHYGVERGGLEVGLYHRSFKASELTGLNAFGILLHVMNLLTDNPNTMVQGKE